MGDDASVGWVQLSHGCESRATEVANMFERRREERTRIAALEEIELFRDCTDAECRVIASLGAEVPFGRAKDSRMRAPAALIAWSSSRVGRESCEVGKSSPRSVAGRSAASCHSSQELPDPQRLSPRRRCGISCCMRGVRAAPRDPVRESEDPPDGRGQ